MIAISGCCATLWATSKNVSRGWRSHWSASTSPICTAIMVTNVTAAMRRTSHPLHTGFSTGGVTAGARLVASAGSRARGWGATGICAGESAGDIGCGGSGVNGELSGDDDKMAWLYHFNPDQFSPNQFNPKRQSEKFNLMSLN